MRCTYYANSFQWMYYILISQPWVFHTVSQNKTGLQQWMHTTTKYFFKLIFWSWHKIYWWLKGWGCISVIYSKNTIKFIIFKQKVLYHSYARPLVSKMYVPFFAAWLCQMSKCGKWLVYFQQRFSEYFPCLVMRRGQKAVWIGKVFICKTRSLYYCNLNLTGHFWINGHWS